MRSLEYVSFTTFRDSTQEEFCILKKVLKRIGNVKIDVSLGGRLDGLEARDLRKIAKVEYVYSKPCYMSHDCEEEFAVYETKIKAIESLSNVVACYKDVSFDDSDDDNDIHFCDCCGEFIDDYESDEELAYTLSDLELWMSTVYQNGVCCK